MNDFLVISFIIAGLENENTEFPSLWW